MAKQRIELAWDPSVSDDATKQVLHVSRNGTEDTPIELAVGESTFEIQEDEGVEISFWVDTYDDASPTPNVTATEPVTFTVTDTTAPFPATGLRWRGLGEV